MIEVGRKTESLTVDPHVQWMICIVNVWTKTDIAYTRTKWVFRYLIRVEFARATTTMLLLLTTRWDLHAYECASFRAFVFVRICTSRRVQYPQLTQAHNDVVHTTQESERASVSCIRICTGTIFNAVDGHHRWIARMGRRKRTEETTHCRFFFISFPFSLALSVSSSTSSSSLISLFGFYTSLAILYIRRSATYKYSTIHSRSVRSIQYSCLMCIEFE